MDIHLITLLFIILLIKSFRPFLRKQLLNTFDELQLMLITSFFTLIIWMIYANYITFLKTYNEMKKKK